MMYRLIVLSGPLTGRRFTVEKAPMTIGRDGTCSISLPDDEAALKHAVIEHRGDGLFIRDQGSMSRILVNGLEVNEARLKHGDEVEIGRTRFLIQAFLEADVVRPTAKVRRRRTLSFATVLTAVGLSAAYLYVRRAVTVTPSSATAPSSKTELAQNTSVNETGEQVLVTSLPQSWSPQVKAPQELPDHTPTIEPVQLISAVSNLPALTGESAIFSPPATNSVTGTPSTIISRATPESAPSTTAVQVAEEHLVVSPVVDVQKSPPASATPVLTAPARFTDVRIVSLTQQRFPSTDEINEMRVVTVELAALGKQMPLEGSIRIEFSFFDRSNSTGAIHPSRATVVTGSLFPDGPWKPNELKAITATYVVPRSPRGGREQEAGDALFHGYVVKVFHNDTLQDIEARPRELLALALPRTAGVPPGPSGGIRIPPEPSISVQRKDAGESDLSRDTL